MMDLHPFEYQKPDDEQTQRMIRIRAKCKELYELLMRELPHCRERSLAITKLEEVGMWGNKAVVFNPPPEGGDR